MTNPSDTAILSKPELPLEYQDSEGRWWIMAACGHHVGGSVKPGQHISLCPNCRFLIRFGEIPVEYPERLEESHRPRGYEGILEVNDGPA
jgi:hypothetical protein